jgi:hypothetical protein
LEIQIEKDLLDILRDNCDEEKKFKEKSLKKAEYDFLKKVFHTQLISLSFIELTVTNILLEMVFLEFICHFYCLLMILSIYLANYLETPSCDKMRQIFHQQ